MKPDTTAEEPVNDDFDQWCFTAQDDQVLIYGKPPPLLTTVLYRICDGDETKFNEAIRFLRLAFEAGQRKVKVVRRKPAPFIFDDES